MCLATLRQLSFPEGKSLVDNPLTAQKEAYRVAYGRINPGIQLNGSCAGHNFIRHPMTIDPYSMQYIVVGAQGIFSNKVDFEKPKEGNGLSSLSINFAIPCKFVPDGVKAWGSCAGLSDEISALQTYSGSLAVCRQTPNVTGQVCNPMDPTGFYEWPANSWKIQLLRAFPPQGQDNPQGRAHFTYYPPTGRIGPGPFALYYVNHTAAITNGQVSTNYEPVSSATFQIQGFGGAYTLIVGITDSVLSDKTDNIAMLHQLLPPGFLSLSWQLPQYILITFTKLMFCITGMEFAYTQAPPSMKTLVQALWLFHLGVGEFLAFLLSTIGVVNLTLALVLCTIGLFTVVLIFAFMAIYNYRYVHFSTIDDDRQQLLKEDLGLGDDTLHKRQNSTSGANTFVTRL
ncbi:hypothetical protein M3Y97_00676100 [Aphelenchoides bicaudatus]|nr:hypothetical protein M3Y97_00676100 [Aphelenchoides bicaudatus]